jgi:hypothetical protein
MSEEEKRRRRTRKKLWLLLMMTLTIVAAVAVVPPLVNVGRYKGRITTLVSGSFGRPVRLSSVELRMLPRPGFVLSDLTVYEDPAYGAEPVLHANAVTAAIRLISLWRGRVEISRISVDEASFNVVRTTDGRWNLDSFFTTAAGRSKDAAQGSVPAFPYLEATNSRVNIKNGLEKLPFSLVNADLSFWQENPGDWRLRLRGQPARTDVSLDLADTGIVRLEAMLRHATEFRDMPIHLEMDWRDAQLGQLSRLILGSDPGWRGDLRGQLQLDGTATAAQVKTRLSATSVHRVEFAPADPLDFDANCAFVYHYSIRTVENLVCDSPFGDGHIKVVGNAPGTSPGKFAIDMERIPVSAGLDVLRTLRSGIPQDLETRGTVSGQLAYDPDALLNATEAVSSHHHSPKNQAAAKNSSPALGPLTGSLNVDGFVLSGDSLSQPVQASRVIVQPEGPQVGQAPLLTATVSVPAGGPTPLLVAARFSMAGYQLGMHGPATLPRIRELAHVAGIGNSSLLSGLAGGPANLDLTVRGPWLPSQSMPPNLSNRSGTTANPATGASFANFGVDQLSGTVNIRNANWKSDALANVVTISEGILQINAEKQVWGPLVFQYGPVKGIANFEPVPICASGEECPPQLGLQFSELDAAALQAALLGAREQGTVFSSLVARFTQSSAPVWPRVNGTINASTLVLGPVRLQNATISARILSTGAELTSIEAGLFNGQIHATGKLINADKPKYSFEGTFAEMTGSTMCQFLALQCSGGTIEGNGKVTLSGFAEADLSATASGMVHFDWRRGMFRGNQDVQIPKSLSRFDHWSGDGVISSGAVRFKQSAVRLGVHSTDADAAITFGNPPIVKVAQVNETPASEPNAQ